MILKIKHLIQLIRAINLGVFKVEQHSLLLQEYNWLVNIMEESFLMAIQSVQDIMVAQQYWRQEEVFKIFLISENHPWEY